MPEDDDEGMPEESALLTGVFEGNLTNLVQLADNSNSGENVTNRPTRQREERVIDDIFKAFNGPRTPPPLPLPLVQYRYKLLNIQQQLQQKQQRDLQLLRERQHVQKVNALAREVNESLYQPTSPGMLNLATEDYHMEKLDPKHRVGFLLAELLPYWEELGASAQGQGFFEWLDSMPEYDLYLLMVKIGSKNPFSPTIQEKNKASEKTQLLMKGVAYLDERTRLSYKVGFSDTKLLQMNRRTFSSAKYSTYFSGLGWAAWVLSESDTFYTGPHIKGEFHHSSFLWGGMVKAAGEWKVEKGKVTAIIGKTGHYQCPVENLVAALKVLQSHAGLTGTYVHVATKFNDKEILANKQRERRGEDINHPKTEAFPALVFISNPVMQDAYSTRLVFPRQDRVKDPLL